MGDSVRLPRHRDHPLLDACIHSVADAIVVVDDDGAIVTLNAGGERLFGHSRDDVVGRAVETLIPQRLREKHVRHRAAYHSSPCPRFMGTDVGLVALHSDGHEFPVEIALTPLPGPDGMLVACAVRQLAKERSTHADLQRRVAELEAFDERKDEFVTTLAHELRGPLTAIRYWLTLLGHAGARPDVKERAAAVIGDQAGQMQRLVEDLTDLDRMRSGELRLEPALLDLSDVIALAVAEVRPLLERRGHALRVEAPSVCVVGDRARLLQIVSNLLTNAARYTPSGGHVAVSLGAERGEAVLRVVDDGIGIPADMLDRVFEPFTRSEAARAVAGEGLGIGLALARRLVDMQGGSIDAHSEGEGRGSTFVVRLPLVQCSSNTGTA